MSVDINLYTPHPAQREVHKLLQNDDIFFTTVIAGRQSGKTLLAWNWLIYWAVKNPSTIIFYVSPGHSQSLRSYKNVYNALSQTPLIKSHKQTPGQAEIELTTGSILKFRSAGSGDNLRGESVNYMVIDEAAFISKETYDSVLLPMLNVGGKKCLVISTPKGHNWVYELYERGMDEGEKKYASFRFTSLDNPSANEEIIKRAKQGLPKEIFAQEYLAEFVDSASVFRGVMDSVCDTSFGDDGGSSRKKYIGIDVGINEDSTVIAVVDDGGRFVEIESFNHTGSPVIREKIKKQIKKHRPRKTFIESNGLGLPIYQELKDEGMRNIDKFLTTNKSKEEIITDLVSAFSKGDVTIPNDMEVITQLEGFTVEVMESGRLKYGGRSGIHDDIPMAMAIAWRCRKKGAGRGKYHFIGG